MAPPVFDDGPQPVRKDVEVDEVLHSHTLPANTRCCKRPSCPRAGHWPRRSANSVTGEKAAGKKQVIGEK
jgi:hypothetical protein